MPSDAPPPGSDGFAFDLDPADLMVTDHAVVRWLERVHGVDMSAARTLLRTRGRIGVKALRRADHEIAVLIGRECGLDLEPVRAMIRREIAAGRAVATLMSRPRSGVRVVRDWTILAPGGHRVVVHVGDDGRAHVPTVLPATAATAADRDAAT